MKNGQLAQLMNGAEAIELDIIDKNKVLLTDLANPRMWDNGAESLAEQSKAIKEKTDNLHNLVYTIQVEINTWIENRVAQIGQVNKLLDQYRDTIESAYRKSALVEVESK